MEENEYEEKSTVPYALKCWVASQTSLNSNFADTSLKNGSINTMGIMSFADYLANERASQGKGIEGIEKAKLNDDNKLARTYVVPLTMQNGERIDIVVNAKGQDLAQIYVDEQDQDKRFHLDDRVENSILAITKDVQDEMKKSGYAEEYTKEFLPENLEELGEKISKDELIPKTEKAAKDREERALGKSEKEAIDDKEQEEEDKNEEGKSIEEIAAEGGTSVDALQKFCDENKIDINTVLVARTINNGGTLSQMIGEDLGDGPVLAIKTKDQDGGNKENAFLATPEGDTVLNKRQYDDVLTRFLPTNGGKDNVNDVENPLGKMKLVGDDGKTQEVSLSNAQIDSLSYLNPDQKLLYKAEIEKQNERIANGLSNSRNEEGTKDVIEDMKMMDAINEKYGIHNSKITSVTEQNVKSGLERTGTEHEGSVEDEKGESIAYSFHDDGRPQDALGYKEEIIQAELEAKNAIDSVMSDEGLTNEQRGQMIEATMSIKTDKLLLIEQRYGISAPEVIQDSLNDEKEASEIASDMAEEEPEQKQEEQEEQDDEYYFGRRIPPRY